MANRNRNAGHQWERDLVKVFRDHGYSHVVTTRSESKSRDDQGIDLMNKDERHNGIFPFNIQAKCTTRLVKYPELLSLLPQEDGVVNLIAHRQVIKHETRFMKAGEYVILSLQDFINLLNGTTFKSGVEGTTK